jgi:hypothetical protein
MFNKMEHKQHVQHVQQVGTETHSNMFNKLERTAFSTCSTSWNTNAHVEHKHIRDCKLFHSSYKLFIVV